MKVTETPLPGVVIVESPLFEDSRGFLTEMYNAERFATQGIPLAFRQTNHSRSIKGVVRGLHYQLNRPQGKLVSIARGEVFDVAVDIRVGSPTFGRWFGVTLSDRAPRALWVPPGFAHGFCALSDVADLIYQCTDVHVANDDRGVLWSDPAIGIEWPVTNPIVSDRDRALSGLEQSAAALPRYES